METGLINLSIKSSMLLIFTTALILHLAYILFSMLKPYFIRNLKNISLRYSQNIYISVYILIKNILFFIATALYLSIMLIFLSGNIDFPDLSAILFPVGTLLLFLYLLVRIWIDIDSTFAGVIIKFVINGLAAVFNIYTFIQYMMGG